MMWLAWLAGAVIGFFCGYLRGVQVRGDVALQALQAARDAVRLVSVRTRKAQEARARYIAMNADEPENRR
jgi:predicted branched-subunit amino acid permease